MPTLPVQSNPIQLPTGLRTANPQPIALAAEVRSSVSVPPPSGNSVDDWILYLETQIRAAELQLAHLRLQLDAVGLTDGTPEWAYPDAVYITRHIAGLRFVSAAPTQRQDVHGAFSFGNPAAGDHYILLRLDDGQDPSRWRAAVLVNGSVSAAYPGASEQWTRIGSPQNAEPGHSYYYLADAQARARRVTTQEPSTGSYRVEIQQNSGSYADFEYIIPDGSIEAAKLAAAVIARLVPSSGITSGQIDAGDAVKQAAWRAAIGIVTSQGHTITDDSILPAWLQSDTPAQALAFRNRIGAAARAAEVSVTWGHSGNADGSSPRGSTGLDVPVGQAFILRGAQARGRDYRFITLPAGHILQSVIGEGGQQVDEWDRQTDMRTYSMGTLGNRGSDPETFVFTIVETP